MKSQMKMPNKATNLEEWLKKSNFYYRRKRIRITPLMIKFAKVVAFRTLGAVRVGERYKEDIHYNETVIYNQGTKTAIYKLGRNSAIKDQQEMAEEWLGEGGK